MKPLQKTITAVAAIDVTFMTLLPLSTVYTMQLPTTQAATMIAGMLGIFVWRIPFWVGALRRSLGRLDRWLDRDPAERTDDELRLAIADVQTAPARFYWSFVPGWIVAYLVAMGFIGWLLRGPDGESPRTIFALLMTGITITVGALSLGQSVARGIISEACADVLTAAAARGVAVRTPSPTVQSHLRRFAVMMAVAAVGSMGGMALRSTDLVEGQRALLSAELAAQRAAAALQAGGTDALPDGVGLAGQGRFDPAVEARALAVTDHDGWLRSGIDRAYGFVRIASGQVVIAEAPVSAAGAWSAVSTTAGFLIVLGVWASITSVLVGREIGQGLARVTTAVTRLVRVGDLREMSPLPTLFDDEIGTLTHHYNELLRSQRQLADHAARVANGDLSGSIDGNGALPDAFRGMLKGLRDLVTSLHGTSVELAAAAAEIYSASQEQEASATEQSAAIVEFSRTMESLSTSSAHIADAVNNVLGDADRTRTTTEQMATRIAELNSHAGRIGELLDVIREIADRSDLLALNGSLEATRAGDAGRGFSLVAGEMRRLAERVTATVSDVRTLVQDIRASGSATVMATEQSRKLAESTSEVARRIAHVAQQQRTATESATAGVRDTANVIAQATAATTQTRISAEQLKAQAETLESMLTRFNTKGG